MCHAWTSSSFHDRMAESLWVWSSRALHKERESLCVKCCSGFNFISASQMAAIHCNNVDDRIMQGWDRNLCLSVYLKSKLQTTYSLTLYMFLCPMALLFISFRQKACKEDTIMKDGKQLLLKPVTHSVVLTLRSVKCYLPTFNLEVSIFQSDTSVLQCALSSDIYMLPRFAAVLKLANWAPLQTKLDQKDVDHLHGGMVYLCKTCKLVKNKLELSKILKNDENITVYHSFSFYVLIYW